MRFEPLDDGLCGAAVGDERNLVDVADSHQGGNVGLMRLRGERIAEKEHCVDLSHGHPASDDQVSAFRTMHNTLHVQAQLVRQKPPRLPGCYQLLGLKEIELRPDELDEVSFLRIMGDQSNHGFRPSEDRIDRNHGSGIPKGIPIHRRRTCGFHANRS